MSLDPTKNLRPIAPISPGVNSGYSAQLLILNPVLFVTEDLFSNHSGSD